MQAFQAKFHQKEWLDDDVGDPFGAGAERRAEVAEAGDQQDRGGAVGAQLAQAGGQLEAVINDLDPSVGIHQQVGRYEVAMNDPGGVDGLESGGDVAATASAISSWPPWAAWSVRIALGVSGRLRDSWIAR